MKHPSAWIAVAGLFATSCLVEDPTSLDEESSSESGDTDDEFRIRDNHPVPVGELLGMVRVAGSKGGCTGMLIASDAVLTAAHCFCTADVIGGNSCVLEGSVTFQNNPASPGTVFPPIDGTAVVHPDYDPSWVDNAINHDLAVVKLMSNAPPHVTRFSVPSRTPVERDVRIAGYGRTGSDCSGPSGTLYQDWVTISGWEQGHEIIRFDDPVYCKGDSGGAVMNTSGTALYGLISAGTFTWKHAKVDKSIGLASHYNWIRESTCMPATEGSCGKGPICLCGVGGHDCNSEADCRPELSCVQNIGDEYGLPATMDVCVYPGSIEGSCGCGNSGVGNICQASVNNCNPGYVPHCTPAQGACAGCSCE